MWCLLGEGTCADVDIGWLDVVGMVAAGASRAEEVDGGESFRLDEPAIGADAHTGQGEHAVVCDAVVAHVVGVAGNLLLRQRQLMKHVTVVVGIGRRQWFGPLREVVVFVDETCALPVDGVEGDVVHTRQSHALGGTVGEGEVLDVGLVALEGVRVVESVDIGSVLTDILPDDGTVESHVGLIGGEADAASELCEVPRYGRCVDVRHQGVVAGAVVVLLAAGGQCLDGDGTFEEVHLVALGEDVYRSAALCGAVALDECSADDGSGHEGQCTAVVGTIVLEHTVAHVGVVLHDGGTAIAVGVEDVARAETLDGDVGTAALHVDAVDDGAVEQVAIGGVVLWHGIAEVGGQTGV